MTAPTYPDIAAFLVAQLDREQQIAEGAASVDHPEWTVDNSVFLESPYVEQSVWVPWAVRAAGKWLMAGGQFEEPMVHIAQHDPAFVLADIAAKRAIVEMFRWTENAAVSTTKYTQAWNEAVFQGIRVLRLLAATFADQPGWQQEWAVG